MLQVAGFLEHSTVNGIGLRSVLFLSGCPHHCLNCQNEEMQAYDYGEKVLIEDIFSRILKNKPLIDGVTFSGGEPFAQSQKLLPLAQMLQQEQLNIWCYTGYTYHELLLDSSKRELLTYIDVLVDGPYLQAFRGENLKYRGSSNQHIYSLKKGLITSLLDDSL